MEGSALTGLLGVTILVGLSLTSLLLGLVFRRWPERVREYFETLDGSSLWLGADAHTGLIKASGALLVAMSFVALLATGLLI